MFWTWILPLYWYQFPSFSWHRAQECVYMWMHTQAPAALLYLPLSHTHKQKYFMLLSQGYLFCLCVCVFTPLVIPVPMVSVALERRVISSFWGVAHWDPGGVQRRGERKMRKEGELLELFRAAHSCTSTQNSWLHVSDVPMLLLNM